MSERAKYYGVMVDGVTSSMTIALLMVIVGAAIVVMGALWLSAATLAVGGFYFWRRLVSDPRKKRDFEKLEAG